MKKVCKKSAKEPISKDMAIGDIVRRYPQTVNIFMESGLHCVGCAVASFETIEEGAKAHGIDLKKLIRDLNKCIKKA